MKNLLMLTSLLLLFWLWLPGVKAKPFAPAQPLGRYLPQESLQKMLAGVEAVAK